MITEEDFHFTGVPSLQFSQLFEEACHCHRVIASTRQYLGPHQISLFLGVTAKLHKRSIKSKSSNGTNNLSS
jgi:hypothetical protein